MVSGLHEKAKKYKIKMRKKNEEKDISKHTSHLIGIATPVSMILIDLLTIADQPLGRISVH